MPHNRLDAIDGFTFTHDARDRVVEKHAVSGDAWKYSYRETLPRNRTRC